ncbi:hypothetical protein ACFY5K_34555 [Streptomyces griseofuscus]|uniref:hypothetical protein n=1 Tax=Streptomyces griseofuscus TaxID=146922 RepID=UPI0036B4E8A8
MEEEARMQPNTFKAKVSGDGGGGKKTRTNLRPDLDFTPVNNGMDYLVSAVKNLTEGSNPPSNRDLKYAVLHLQAATEVLLKARLVRVHWSLVFKNPGNAKLADFKKGSFDSCNLTATMDRLENIGQVAIDAKDREAIDDLSKARNALTHYGHTDNAYAVEAKAVKVLSFLINFIHKHLKPALSKEAEGVEETMSVLRQKLRGIERLVKDRMQELTSSLAPFSERTVECPVCFQWALVAGEREITCRFCLAAWDSAMYSAAEYGWIIRGEDDFPGLKDCPECHASFVVGLVNTVDSKDVDVALCFHCGTVYQEKGSG